MALLQWIRANSPALSAVEQDALAEADQQVAGLEEKEVELRFISARLDNA